MNKIIKLGLAVCASTMLSGCLIVAGDRDWDRDDRSSWEERQEDNRDQISKLQMQTTRSEVISNLGSPDFSEAFMKGNDEYRVLYYRTQHLHSDGDTTKDETTPLIFKNDKLIGWGDDVLASARH